METYELQIIEEYDKGKSTHEVAELFFTYPNKINRILKKYGRKLRDKSEAQGIALSSGRHKHPTKGTKRSEDEKIKISNAVAKHWENTTDEEKEEKSRQAKEQWANMSQSEKMALQTAASEAVRLASKEGSKMEKFLLDKLTHAGYNVVSHYKHIIGTGMEVDLFIPELKTVIEVDGPSHFYPIWGDVNLQKRIKSDLQKTGILIGRKFFVIRIKHLVKSVSLKHQNDTLKQVIEHLDIIKNGESEKLIEIEVK